MSTPEHPSPAPRPTAPESPDRAYRSPAALAGGVLLLGIIGWLGIDAIVKGHGRTPWLALATLLLVVPLVVAFTLRPAVFANEERLRIRNPFRVVVVPWSRVVSLRSSFSNEVVIDSGAKYQLWAVPVSLRGRKKASRRQARAAAEASRAAQGGGRGGRGFGGGFSGFGGGFGGFGGTSDEASAADGPARAETDKVMDDLRELLAAQESRATGGTSGTGGTPGTTPAAATTDPTATTPHGEVTARWAYEIVAPALAGAVVLAILLATG
ncbi:PH domain-containing protein [Streptomyces sp. DSM 41014]|uniref:PH domain-containing protein n=1 Tax=Streptomyces hintoniae TaxID=3075521 RepID=A0ABU2UK55_9ACTN|nr:PH domain-containing protein [Streptomyces sp. DSM 41014]MDT0473485.1 PH domain-containing protein [Streptomyces sp. DSM 41014]